MDKPNYYAIIPAVVRYNNDINANEKLLYGEITALTQSTGICWASNQYFSKLYGVTPQAISKWIKNLERNNLITISYEYKENTKMIERRHIRLSEPKPNKVSTQVSKVSTQVDGGINTGLEGYQRTIKDNTTSINNTSINNKDLCQVKEKLDQIPHKEIIDYLNKQTNKNYRNVESNKKYIRTRWNEGYRLNDFKVVVDNKVAEWLEDEKMKKYLRPSTLFGTNFDNYLNQKVKKEDDEYVTNKVTRF